MAEIRCCESSPNASILSLPCSILLNARAMRWLFLWLLLTATYVAGDLTLRAAMGEGWPPSHDALLACAIVPLLQTGALRLVHWMRRSVRR